MASETRPEPLGDARATLGEGPVWDAGLGRLHWVDIAGRRVHATDPSSGAGGSFPTADEPGCVAVSDDGGLVLAAGHRVLATDGDGGSLCELGSVPASPRLRFNDGKCDPAGRLWAGTMDREERQPLGTLYRFSPGGEAEPAVTGVTVSNGIGWSPEADRMYYIDSPRRCVWMFPYRLDSGAIDVAARQTLATFPESDGFPDGMAVDAEGFLWVAFWLGGRVRRLHPHTGETVGSIGLPASKVTSCAFGGARLEQLFITTARVGLGADDEPLAGRLFVCEPGVTGLPASRFGRG